MSTLPEKSKFDEYVKMGLLRSQKKDDMTIYQYTELTQFDRLWNSVTLAARGIVFDDSGEVVQRCFPKFFNSDEPEGIVLSKTMEASSPIVQDKVDGSLIKVSFDEKHGVVITSKASFESDQAKWATQIIDEEAYEFMPGLTYHFELIHPKNQIVLNYGDKRALILLAIIDNQTGKEVNIYRSPLAAQFELVELLPESVLSDVNKLNERGLCEGVVVNFGTYRLKMKTEEYVRIHRIVTNFTPKRVWEALSAGQRIERENVPEEFLAWLEETERDILLAYNSMMDEINQALVDTQDLSNKEIGLSDNPMKHFIFASRSGKDLSEKVWKAIKPKGGDDES